MNSIKRGIPALMLISVIGVGTMMFENGFSFADTKRPAQGTIEFGAGQNPASGTAENSASFSSVFVDIADKVVPTVVSVIPTKIDTVVYHRNPFYNFEGNPFSGDNPFEYFFGQPRQRQLPPKQPEPQVRKEERRQQGLGSGVIVSSEGYILTNSHVVSGADEIEVKLHDGRTVKAEIVGSDSLSDVAVLKMNEKIDDLPVAYLGDSEKLRPGDWVVAVGNPFSLTSTVTTGIVSALGRSVGDSDSYQNFIQTDAAINPGNSGGALVNIQGELIGINTMIYSRSGGFMGIGFAVPVNMAKRVMEDLIYNGEVVRGWIGATIQDIDEDVRAALDLGEVRGVLVADVLKGQPAYNAGIKHGDIITTIGIKEVKSANDLRNIIAELALEKKVPVKVYREGKTIAKEIIIGRRDQKTLAQAKNSESTSGEKENALSQKLGFTAVNLTQEMRGNLSIDKNFKGVLVTEVDNPRTSIKEGDLISQIKTKNGNFISVENVNSLQGAIKDLKDGDSVLLLIKRGESVFFTAFRVG